MNRSNVRWEETLPQEFIEACDCFPVGRCIDKGFPKRYGSLPEWGELERQGS